MIPTCMAESAVGDNQSIGYTQTQEDNIGVENAVVIHKMRTAGLREYLDEYLFAVLM